jgi:hypothetical protein
MRRAVAAAPLPRRRDVLAALQAPQKAMTLATRTRRAQAARVQRAAALQLTLSRCLAATHRPPMLLRRRPATALVPTWLAMRRSLPHRRCHRCSLLRRWLFRLRPPMLRFRR